MSIVIENCIVKSCIEDTVIPDTDFATFFTEVCRKYKQNIALVDATADSKCTFGELCDAFERVAGGLLELGIRPGDSVGFHCSNGIELVVALCGAVLAGGTAVFAKTNLNANEVHYQFRSTSPVVVICDYDKFDKVTAACKSIPSVQAFVVINSTIDGAISFCQLRNNTSTPPQMFPRASSSSVLAILYSSGTTGLPKGVQLTHRNLIAQMIAFGYNDPSVHDKEDCYLQWVPIMHVSGLWLLFAYLAQGCRVILVRSTDISLLLSAAEKYHATSTMLHPATAVQLSQHPLLQNGGLKSLRKLMTGGGTAQAQVMKTIAEKLGLDGVARAYGLSETHGGTCISPPTLEDFRKNGKPAAFMQMKVVDTETRQTLGPYQVGEICMKGAMVFKGYHERPEETAETMHEDFLLTGDMGYYDSEGDFFITGRLKDLIKCMDQQVSPTEIEHILADDPAVQHVIVVGVPHPVFREAARAFIVHKQRLHWSVDRTCMESEAARLSALVVDKLSYHKHLHGGIEFVDSIPETGTGKELRRVLRDTYIRSLEASQE